MNIGEIIKQKLLEDDARKESALIRAKKAFDNGATIVVPNPYFTDTFYKHTNHWLQLKSSIEANDYEFLIK